MRILVISNGYPPAERDDLALGCREIVESLEARNHRVLVLTGGSGRRESHNDGEIHRQLIRDRPETMNWQTVVMKEVVNQAAFRMLCRDFRPEIVLLFDLSNISFSLGLIARDLGLPTCHHIADDGLAAWELDRWYQEQPKGPGGYRALRFLIRRFELRTFPRSLDFPHVIFTSRYLETATRQAGKSVLQSTVIPWGIDTGRFCYQESRGEEPRRLLYAGPLEPQKGIEIAIRALGILKKERGDEAPSLTIAGNQAASADYVSYLHQLASSCGVLRNLTFVDYAPARSTPDLYRTHDVFLHPSVLIEPLTISPLEAMSCGLGIIATATGGNSEILEDGSNALVIPKEDPESCARQIGRLLDDPSLYESLRTQARRTIEERCALGPAIDAIENVLKDAAGHAVSAPQPEISGELPVWTERTRLRQLIERADRARRSLIWSGYLVQAKNLVKPKTLHTTLKSHLFGSFSHVALLVFPALFDGFYRLIGRRSGDSMTNAGSPREVLVVQLADLGDVILSGPFLYELRRFFPKARITLVVQPEILNLVEKCPHVDEVQVFDWRTVKDWKLAFQGHIRWWWKALGMAVRNLSKHHYDLAVSPRWNEDPCQAASLILMSASGAPQRVAYIDGVNSYTLHCPHQVSDLITEGPTRGASKHEIEYQLDVLRFLGTSPETPRLEVWTTPEDERFARGVLDQDKILDQDLLIAFAPGAAWSFRRWPAGRFIELGRWLQDRFQAVILILAGKSEQALAAEIEQGLRAERTVNLAGRTTMREMAAVLKSCRFFVGNDSGPMHVAVAAGVTAIGLFGPGDYDRFKPWGTKSEVVRLGLTCNPCSENCKFSEALCIQGIAVSQVQDVFSKMLERTVA